MSAGMSVDTIVVWVRLVRHSPAGTTIVVRATVSITSAFKKRGWWPWRRSRAKYTRRLLQTADGVCFVGSGVTPEAHGLPVAVSTRVMPC